MSPAAAATTTIGLGRWCSTVDEHGAARGLAQHERFKALVLELQTVVARLDGCRSVVRFGRRVE